MAGAYVHHSHSQSGPFSTTLWAIGSISVFVAWSAYQRARQGPQPNRAREVFDDAPPITFGALRGPDGALQTAVAQLLNGGHLREHPAGWFEVVPQVYRRLPAPTLASAVLDVAYRGGGTLPAYAELRRDAGVRRCLAAEEDELRRAGLLVEGRVMLRAGLALLAAWLLGYVVWSGREWHTDEGSIIASGLVILAVAILALVVRMAVPSKVTVLARDLVDLARLRHAHLAPAPTRRAASHQALVPVHPSTLVLSVGLFGTAALFANHPRAATRMGLPVDVVPNAGTPRVAGRGRGHDLGVRSGLRRLVSSQRRWA